MSYPIYPNSGPAAVHPVEGTPGKVVTPPTGLVKNPYPLYGDEGAQCLPEEESTSSTKYATGAGQYSNPYPVHGLQYALDKAMVADKNVTHSQSGDIRHADDMSGGNPIERAKPGKVAAVSAALDKMAGMRVKGATAGNQVSAFKRANKGSKAGSPARDMQLRHAGTQADVNSAASQR